MVQVTREQVLTASDGNQYKITVTYGSDAGIPEDAELSVSEFASESKEYKKYVKKAAKKLDSKVDDFNFAHAFDISLVNPETGEHYQPTKPLKVSVKLLDENVSKDSSVNVVHFGDVTEVLESSVNAERVEFETDGFSVYVVCAYTVDFHWGDYTYSIAGEQTILLSELLERLGVTELSASDVTALRFSNEKLIQIEQQGSDWLLRSLAPFDTEETLTLTLADGQSVSIRVTDNKVAPEVTAPTAVANLVYNGQAQELITAGTTTGGTLMYSLTETGDYSADLPTGTDAGSYTVYYKVVGNDSYEDVAASHIDVTMQKCDVTVTITGSHDTATYDGTEHSVNGYTATATDTACNVNSDITFSGTAAATRKDAGTTNMGLTPAQFTNSNTNCNVTFTVVDGYQTVERKSVTVRADDKEKLAGATDPEYTATVTGLVDLWEEGQLYTTDENANGRNPVAGNVIPGIGNFLTETLSGKKNGGKDYFQTRQDIFIDGFQGVNATSLVVTGRLTQSNDTAMNKGSIWVGAAESPHYLQNMQFASFGENALDTDGKVKSAVDAENTMKAFRNAYDDETTENGTDSYLYGEAGNGVYINWSGVKGSARVILKKVGSAYEPLKGAEFELYRGDAQIEWPGTSPTNLATSTDIGVLWIGDLPYGEYYLKETQAPTKAAGAATSAYAGNKDKWFCLIVDKTGVWMSENGYKDEATAAANKAKALADATAVKTTALAKIDNSSSST